SPRRHHNHGSPPAKAKHGREEPLKASARHGHKRKKSRSRSPSKPREHSEAAKKHRHERGHHRERRERSRSFDRAHKGKHHGSGRSGHGRHRR
ncbi:CCNL1 protein, partial [Neodrepanis coruscans]|nr:CCNL1 protein [Neodrepanis coruscans]